MHHLHLWPGYLGVILLCKRDLVHLVHMLITHVISDVTKVYYIVKS